MKSLILFTISSLFLFNNKALSIAPPTPKLNIPSNNGAENSPHTNNESPVPFTVKPTKEVISQAFGIEPNNSNILPTDLTAASMTTPTGVALLATDPTLKHLDITSCCNPYAVGQVTAPNRTYGANSFTNSIGQLNNQSGDQAQ